MVSMITFISKRIQEHNFPSMKFDYNSHKRKKEFYIASRFCNYIRGDSFEMRESPDSILKKEDQEFLIEITSCEYVNSNNIPNIKKFIWNIQDELYKTKFVKNIDGLYIKLIIQNEFLEKIHQEKTKFLYKNLHKNIIKAINTFLINGEIVEHPDFRLKINEFPLFYNSNFSFQISITNSTHLEDSYEFYFKEINNILFKKSLKNYKKTRNLNQSKLILIIEINPLCFKIKDLLDYFEDKKFINSESFDEIYIFSEDNFYKII